MENKFSVHEEVVKDYDRRAKKRETVLWTVTAVCVVVWGTAVYFDVPAFLSDLATISPIIAMFSVLQALFTECPNCHGIGIRLRTPRGAGKCSSCGFPLVEEK